jgi:hypothetical protein
MKINIHSKQDNTVYISAKTDELIYTDNDYDIGELSKFKIYTKETKSADIRKKWLKMPFRLVLGILDALFLNLPEKWEEIIEPYFFESDFISVDSNNDSNNSNKPFEIKYTPSSFDCKHSEITKPKLSYLENSQKKEIALKTEIDKLSVKKSFVNYLIHFISIGFYPLMLFLILTILTWDIIVILIGLFVGACLVGKLIFEYRKYKKISAIF